jgi:AcrR family transcriptional regulator
MAEPGSRRGRTHDAEGTREAILNAAEEVFAEHGFDGARIDAIAETAGYNKSLIFHYFGDKLGLYAEVLKRADRQGNELQARVLAPLIEDERVATDAHRFRTVLETALRIIFDYLIENPRVMRIIVWEQAEGWQTYAKIVSQFDTQDIDQFKALFSRAQKAGLLRSNIDPFILLIMAEQMCWSYLTSIPLYQTILPGEDLSSSAALKRVREQIIEFVVHGIMVDPPETRP